MDIKAWYQQIITFMILIDCITAKAYKAALPLHFFLERCTQSCKTEMSEYIKSLKNGKIDSVGGEDGMSSLKIGLAAIKSIQEKLTCKY